ncbi:uncharacterized protein DSM5745_06181 [Aspergillus mulundensis]|uniref:Uncharacterized protein n=1 Tax=Aspergillus mulundensis TaxID=1810919 RepID=A0A3D8RZ45_9EURO|nr:hypothetical protein DSM5745_06181 [Aspergillus mulundensis]RDW79329.1 hypothetical protein DSM5745_06181 [Aspergillus mulundensis]
MSLPIPLELLSTGLRLWAELYQHRKKLAVDDFLMIWATMVGIGACVSGLIATSQGFGKHMAALGPTQYAVESVVCPAVWLHDRNALLTAPDVLRLHMDLRCRDLLYQAAGHRPLLPRLPVHDHAAHRHCNRGGYRDLGHSRRRHLGIRLSSLSKPPGRMPEGYSSRLGALCWRHESGPGRMDLAPPIAVDRSDADPHVEEGQVKLSVYRLFRVCILRILSRNAVLKRASSTCGISATRLALVAHTSHPDFTYTQAPAAMLMCWELLGGILCANLPIIYKPIAVWVRRLFGIASEEDESPTASTLRRYVMQKARRFRHSTVELFTASSATRTADEGPMDGPGGVVERTRVQVASTEE